MIRAPEFSEIKNNYVKLVSTSNDPVHPVVIPFNDQKIVKG